MHLESLTWCTHFTTASKRVETAPSDAFFNVHVHTITTTRMHTITMKPDSLYLQGNVQTDIYHEYLHAQPVVCDASIRPVYQNQLHIGHNWSSLDLPWHCQCAEREQRKCDDYQTLRSHTCKVSNRSNICFALLEYINFGARLLKPKRSTKSPVVQLVHLPEYVRANVRPFHPQGATLGRRSIELSKNQKM